MIFDKNWFKAHQRKLLKVANSSYGKSLLCIDREEKIVKIEPNAITWLEGDCAVTEFHTHDKYAKRLYYGAKYFWKMLHAWDIVFANNFIPKLNLGFDTLTAYPDAGSGSTTVDGKVYRTAGGGGEILTDIVAGAGTTADATPAGGDLALLQTASNSALDKFGTLLRSIFTFDTSAITAANPILWATFSICGTGNSGNSFVGPSPSLHLVSSNPASNNALIAADYSTLGSTSFASVNFDDFNMGGYNALNLSSAGVATISKTGITKLGLRSSWDLNGVFGGVWQALQTMTFFGYYADQTGTSQDPRLVVSYKYAPGAFFI